VANQHAISVVVASAAGGDFLIRCLDSLEQQAQELGAQVIVVDRCGPERRSELTERYPSILVAQHPDEDRPSVPQLRASGVDHCKAPIVAVIEEHCVAPPNWLQTILATFRADDDAIGGPILDADFDRIRDWVVYFSEYHNDLPPWSAESRTWLNDANAAYRRQRLIENRASLGESYWAISLHPLLVAAGASMRAVPEMGLAHTGPFDYGYYLRQRYLLSRVWGGTQRYRVSVWIRLAHLIAVPIFPLFLLARIARRTFATGDARLRNRFLKSLPLLLPVVITFTWGEWLGYLLGPGRAAEEVE
jgi:glycosyltransferase involved in cell wall biosynthesis